MIEITHTADEGTVARGVPRSGEPAQALSAIGWRWSHHLNAWELTKSRLQSVSILHVDEAAEALRSAGFEVSLRIDDEQPHRQNLRRLLGAQIMHLEGKLSKVDRLLDAHFETIGAGTHTSVATDLWTIRMLIRRIELDERLRRCREVSQQPIEDTPARTAGKSRNSGTGRTQYQDHVGHGPVDRLDGPLP